MTIAKVRLGDVRNNPFRRFEEFPLIEEKVAALQNSIQETGFWDNVLGRIVECRVEIAYGHHRIEAAKRVYGEDHEIGITIRELSDIEMLRVKRVYVEIDADIHRLMHLQAVTEKKTIRRFLEELIVNYMKQLNG